VIAEAFHLRRVEAERVPAEQEDDLLPIEWHHEHKLCNPALDCLPELAEPLRDLRWWRHPRLISQQARAPSRALLDQCIDDVCFRRFE